MKPYYKNELTTIYNGDCLEVMDYLIEQGVKVDAIITSPPYDNIRKYKGFAFNWKSTIDRIYKIVIDGGVVIWIVNDQTTNGSESGTSFKQALYFKEVGFNLHDTMIYAKTNPIPLTHNRYEQQFEYMFVFSKGKLKTFNPLLKKNKYSGANLTGGFRNLDEDMGKERNTKKPVREFSYKNNIWFYNVGFNKTSTDKIAFEHPAIFPEQLVVDHIESWTNKNDLILDCFLGSGTTIKMAQQYERQSIGIELSKEYCELSVKRIKNIQMRLDI
jgi:site-specific DNA-methyltransferase (adenine-specific)